MLHRRLSLCPSSQRFSKSFAIANKTNHRFAPFTATNGAFRFTRIFLVSTTSSAEQIRNDELQSVLAKLQQDFAHLKQEQQHLKKKNEEIQQQLKIVDLLRKEAKIDIPSDADDDAIEKILSECKFPLLTEKVTLCWANQITAVNIQRIVAACPNITEMDLQCCGRLSDASLQHLAPLNNLKSLVAIGLMTDVSLQPIASLRNLTSLNISYSRGLTDDGLKSLSSLTNLRSLDLGGCNFSDAGIGELLATSSFENLETLNLRACENLSEDVLQHVATKQPKLVELDFQYNRDIGDASLRLVSEMKKLRTLRVGSEKITDDGVQSLTFLKTLKDVSLYKCTSISDQAISSLAKLDLESLHLFGCTSIGDQSISVLTKSNLQWLNVSACRLTDAGVAEMSKISSLKFIGLTCCDLLTDKCLEHLATMQNLAEVDIPGGQFSEEAIDKLQEALPKCDIIIESKMMRFK
jgi:hypothetical protein